MPVTNPSDVQKKPIKVKSEVKHFGKLLSRDTTSTTGKSSREVYYGDVSIAIPFRWESQPGTPIVNSHERSYPLPPLTPPPSYQRSPAKKKLTKNHLKPNLLQGVFPRLSQWKRAVQSSPTSLSSSSSSSSSYSSSPWRSTASVPSSPSTAKAGGEQIFPNAGVSLRSRMEEHDDESPGPTLCFGIRRSTNVRPLGYSTSLFKLMLDDAA